MSKGGKRYWYKFYNNFFENEITLPLHTCLTDEDVGYVIEQYINVIKEYI